MVVYIVTIIIIIIIAPLGLRGGKCRLRRHRPQEAARAGVLGGLGHVVRNEMQGAAQHARRQHLHAWCW